MGDNYKGAEKREFFRYRHEKPLSYNVISSSDDKNIVSKLIVAVSQNLSASGILFTTNFLPNISSLLVLDLDYRTTQICREIEDRALIINNRLLGKVVRIEDNDNGTYSVGVAFVKKSEKLPKDIKTLVV